MPTETVKNAVMSIPDALLASLVGFCIVFFVLVVLFVGIKILRQVVQAMEGSKAPAVAHAAVAAAPVVPAVNPNMIPAKGSIGEINLHGVDDKTAAMLMAIVADEMQVPLNQLRFNSIREKK